MANKPNGTLYVGVTSDLVARAYQHRNALIEGFTKEHGCTLLVWFETHDDLQERGCANCRSRNGSGPGRLN